MAFNLTKNSALAGEMPSAFEKWKTWAIGLIAGLFVAAGVSYYFPAATFTVFSTTQVIAETQVDPIARDKNTTFVTPEDLKVPVTFAPGSSSLAEKDKKMVKRIVIYLIQNPEASIHIAGYASSDGSVEMNQKLSQARADVFKKYLVSYNIDETRVIATGKGVERFATSNAAGGKKNRRVEINFFKLKSSPCDKGGLYTSFKRSG